MWWVLAGNPPVRVRALCGYGRCACTRIAPVPPCVCPHMRVRALTRIMRLRARRRARSYARGGFATTTHHSGVFAVFL